MFAMNRLVLLMLTLVSLSGAFKLSAQGTAFNYQGRLSDAGAPANGKYDLRFAVFNAMSNGAPAGIALTNFNVPVSNGLFNVTLDFGSGLFTGTNYWLDIAVRATNVTTVFTTLVPRQPILPVPYAIFANSASNVLGTLSASQLTSGTVPPGQLSGTYPNTVSFTSGANTFAGNGASLSNLNASQLTSGTVADARLSSNVALLDHNQTFSGANNLTNFNNNFSGNFFGNGLVGWIPTNGPIVQAVRDTGYLLTNSQLATIVLPVEPNVFVKDIVRISGAGPGGWQTAQAANQSIIGNFFGYRNSAWVQTFNAASWRCLASSADGRTMYAGSANLGGIFSSTDYGHTWSDKGNSSGSGWTGLACSADGTMAFAVATSANIQRFTNSGSIWSAVGPGSANWVAVDCAANGNNVLAAINGGSLYLSTNSGAAGTWNPVGPGNNNWSAVSVSPDGTKMAASIFGKSIYLSTNSGVNWSSNAPFANWTAVKISADGNRIAASASGNTIYTLDGTGAAWSKTSAPTNSWTCLAASTDCARLVAGFNGGALFASVNFGSTWAVLNTPTNQSWMALASSADGSQLVAGVSNNITGYLYYSGSSTQATTQTSTNGVLSGSQGSAVELQYIGNGRFMPVSSTGPIWAN